MSGGSSNLRMTTLSYWVGGLLLMGASATIYLTRTINDVTAAIVLLGTLLMLSSFFAYIGVSREARDERARKLGTLAATWSWYITLSFTAMVLVFSYWNGRVFDPTHLLSTIVFIMAASMLATNLILSRRGDVE